MRSLYSLSKGQEAIRDLVAAIRELAGNLSAMKAAGVVRLDAEKAPQELGR